MEVVIVILALLFVAFVSLGVYVSVKAVGAAKRGVDRTLSNARRTVEDTTLRARSLGQIGVAGELAQLRVRLRTSMRATQEILQAGVAEDASLSESVALFQRLSVHGRELDEELRRVERDPDRARVAEHLQELRERTERITHSADSLRWAARDRARQFAEDDLSSLSAQIDVESGALRHWSASAAEPQRQGEWPESAERSEQHVVWPEPGNGSGPTTGPEAEPRATDEGRGSGQGQTQAIEPPGIRQRIAYPWQKRTGQARPETTN
ncbi:MULTISPECIES: hypothetical protein [unclassified Streptomyces]|uniref:hypothetical protein n=1 Tax=unclassified Streptomyces TaxID=2593676 RepID=UPI00081DCAE7|nr:MULTISPECIES: hypothetical protein [unclassified Streptomyces]MYZ39741.1 hypothetical protein [Streptomyces sp. SID4917]SCG05061.1 hypothetical protein GA0115259_109294 [Streptomyces sp. MnatMP-M17]